MAVFPVTTFLFTDVEGSTRLWETEPQRMRVALAAHDAIARRAVEAFRGTVVKTTGDGMHAVFADALDALCATLELQQALADPGATGGLALRVRCGLHEGAEEARDNDFFGPAVNRAARIMGAAHGGQVLVSRALAERLRGRLPRQVALRDLGLARLRDLTDPERIFQVVHPQLRQDFPALRSLEATPNNLPQQMTPFIGRERALQDVRRLLANTRLLTLTGAGGLGKTRLALQLAADSLDEFPDGVWFVELAPIADATLVAQAVGAVLGVREDASRPLSEVLAAHARDRTQLFVLDNCEHLLQSCADLITLLLRSGPAVKIVVTSRESLHVAGETSYAVPTLSVPALDDSGRTGEAEAVKLFVARAHAANVGFELTRENARAVAAICRQLDGIPLALELAAARLRALPVETIASRLGDRFRLLTRGDRAALPRQQSLRALIDWSHELLTVKERALLRRLSVFSGGWTLEAAEAVCTDDMIEAEDVVDLLAHLVDKSLVSPEAGGMRYRMLETIRQYARERLEEVREKKAVRSRHLAYYVTVAERARGELTGPRQGEWLARIDAERENLIAAHRWCDRLPDGATVGLQLLNAIKLYWFARGLLGLGLRLTQEALARPGAQTRNVSRCRGLFNAGQILAYGARYDHAVESLQEGLGIARELNDERNQLALLQPLALALSGSGDTNQAMKYAQEALELARRQDSKHQLIGAINALAQLHRAAGHADMAEALYEEVVTLARERDDRQNIAIGLLNLAMVAVCRGTSARARAQVLEVLAIAEEIGSEPVYQSALEVCAGLAAAIQDWRSCALFFGAAEGRSARSGIHRDPTDEKYVTLWVERARQTLGAAHFSGLEAEGRALADVDAIARLRGWLAAGDAATR